MVTKTNTMKTPLSELKELCEEQLSFRYDTDYVDGYNNAIKFVLFSISELLPKEKEVIENVVDNSIINDCKLLRQSDCFSKNKFTHQKYWRTILRSYIQ